MSIAPPTQPGAIPERLDPYAALREPNYRLFAGGWLLASMGLQMQGTALLWEIYERTGDALALGFIGLARALPVLVLALPAGQLVDMLDRRRVLLGTQIAFAAASLLLALGSYLQVSVWLMYVLVTLTGCARVFNGPSRSSLLPQIVKKDNFHNAVTWNSGVFQLSATLGPVIAGTMIAWSGHWLGKPAAWPVYAATSLSCVWFAIACSFVKPHAKQAVYKWNCLKCDYALVGLERDREGRVRCPECGVIDEMKSVGRGNLDRTQRNGIHGVWSVIRPSSMLPGMMEGVRHVWREKAVCGALALDLFAVLLGGATALMPVYAKDILHVGPVGLGILKASPYVGALLMAFVIAHRPPFQRAGRALLWSIAGFGLCTIAFGLSTSFLLSVSMLFLLGALDNISVVIRHTLVTVRTPDALRGRVSAVNSVFIESSNEIGAFESGLVAKFFGPVVSVVSGGIGTVLVVLATAAWLPELRRLGRLEEPSQPADDTVRPGTAEAAAIDEALGEAVRGAPDEVGSASASR